MHTPEYLVPDYVKYSDNNTIHVAFQALCEYQAQKGHLPRPWHKLDAMDFVTIASKLNSELPSPFEDLNADLLMLFASVSSGNLCPVQAVIGGLVAQEAMKACSGKFHPIVQYLYYDCRECLPENYKEMFHELDDQIHDYSR